MEAQIDDTSKEAADDIVEHGLRVAELRSELQVESLAFTLPLCNPPLPPATLLPIYVRPGSDRRRLQVGHVGCLTGLPLKTRMDVAHIVVHNTHAHKGTRLTHCTNRPHFVGSDLPDFLTDGNAFFRGRAQALGEEVEHFLHLGRLADAHFRLAT